LGEVAGANRNLSLFLVLEQVDFGVKGEWQAVVKYDDPSLVSYRVKQVLETFDRSALVVDAHNDLDLCSSSETRNVPNDMSRSRAFDKGHCDAKLRPGRRQISLQVLA